MGYDYAKKLQAMMAKAASTPSSEEADSIMQMVHQMMQKHGISLLDLNTHLSDDPVGITDPKLHYWAADKWVRPLVTELGFFYGTRNYYTQRGNKTTILVNGRESCRVTFTLMAPYLIRTVKRVAAEAYREGLYETLSKANRDVGTALTQRIIRLRYESMRNAGPRAQAGMNALVPVDALDIIESDYFGYDIEKAISRKKEGATVIGRALASEISLAHQIDPSAIDEGRLLT